MLRRILIACAAIAACLAVAAPAQAGWDWSRDQSPARAALTAPAAPETPQAATWTLTGWKLGRLPAQSTLCVANGTLDITSYNYKYVIEQINNSSWGPNISVLNRCDGYSIENRMTIEAYVASGTTCAKFTNTGRVWDAAQDAYVWNQNVVLWYNLSDYCVGDDTVRAHRTGMFMEYVLGLSYDPAQVNAVISSSTWAMYNVKYVTFEDRRRLGYVYGVEA